MQQVLCLSAVLGLLAPAALPQSNAPTPTQFPLPDTVLHDVGDGGARWALGHAYKARAAGDGFTYVPFLGAEAPRNFPVSMRVTSVTVGDEDLALEREATVRVVDDTLTLDRGPVDVLYELGLDSVEQIFVLEDVAPKGDVRVSLEIESELVLVSEGAGLRFVGPHGDVRYGAAIAIAPDGRTSEVRAERTDAGFDLVVPAAFAETVDGELVIDPVISTGSVVGSTTSPSASVDIGSDPDVGFVAAIERTFSATDGDVFLYSIPQATQSTAGVFAATIDISVDSWTEPSVSGRDQNDDFLVVAIRGLGINRRVWGRIASASGPGWSLDPKFIISFFGRIAHAPDVGADHVIGIFSSNRWMAVWEEDRVGEKYTSGAIIGAGGTIVSNILVGANAGNEFSPVISETAGPKGTATSQRFTVAYMRESTGIGNEVIAMQYGHDGSVVTSPYVAVQSTFVTEIDVAGPIDVTAPNGENPFLIAYGTRALIGNGRWLRTTVCAGGTVFGSTSISEMSDEGRDRLQTDGVVAAEGDQFLVVYQERDDLGGPSDIVMCSGGVANGYFGLAERRQFLTQTPFDEVGPSVATEWEGGRDLLINVGFAAWTNDAPVDEVEGGAIAAYPLETTGYQYCEANINSSGRTGWIAAFGQPNVTDTKRLIVWDAAPTSACFILVSRSQAFVPLVAGSRGNLCLGGLGFGRYSNFASNTDGLGRYELYFDPQAISQPMGSVAAQPGETWYFQAWFRDSIGGGATSNMTNAVAIPFE